MWELITSTRNELRRYYEKYLGSDDFINNLIADLWRSMDPEYNSIIARHDWETRFLNGVFLCWVIIGVLRLAQWGQGILSAYRQYMIDILDGLE